jgi:hypothetical protein
MLMDAIALLFESLYLYLPRNTEENRENKNENIGSSSRDLNSGTHEYVEGMLPGLQLRSF